MVNTNENYPNSSNTKSYPAGCMSLELTGMNWHIKLFKKSSMIINIF